MASFGAVSILLSSDGYQIYTKTWSDPHVEPIALVLAFHGVGEHITRYDHVFTEFARNGIIVKGMDIRGHGHTHRMNIDQGLVSKLGYQMSFKAVWNDMIQLYELPVQGVPDAKLLPTVVFGHSLGNHTHSRRFVGTFLL